MSDDQPQELDPLDVLLMSLVAAERTLSRTAGASDSEAFWKEVLVSLDCLSRMQMQGVTSEAVEIVRQQIAQARQGFASAREEYFRYMKPQGSS